MTMQQFEQLDEMDKVSAIMQYGKLMVQNTEDHLKIFLYRLETFYVSASYNLLNDQLTEINCYTNAGEAMPYCRKQLILIHPAERQYDTPGN